MMSDLELGTSINIKDHTNEPLLREFEMTQRVDRLKDARARILPCRPPVWAPTGHMQTLLGHLLPSRKLKEKGLQLNVSLESEDERIATTYLRGRSSTVVYLFHGLGGYSHAHYMQRTALIARNFGHHVFLNNHRGCGEGAGLAVEPYHSGRAEDLSAVIAYGRQMLPHHRHIAIGFSLSANALLLLAAGVRASVLPDAAIAVNGPIDLTAAANRLDEGLNLIYSLNFTSELKVSVKTREKTGRLQDAYKFPLITTVRDFDRIYTAPAGGFKSRDEYYTRCSAKQYLGNIQIPTVLLTAEDDPFISVDSYRTAKLSDSTILHVEKHGGHMGYLTNQSTPVGSSRWLDYALREYISALS